MKIEKEMIIISGFMGFTVGVCSMMMVNIDKEIIEIEKDVVPIRLIQENINTCEDMIEWMNEDIWNGRVDSTHYENYIYNLNQMAEENRYILQTEYDY